MLTDLAEKMYTDAIRLKRYNSNKIQWFWHRAALKKDLRRMTAQVDQLIDQLRQAQTHSAEYTELALYMSEILDQCIRKLDSGDRTCYESVRRMVWGFHNLPRAFLSMQNTMRISAKTAMDYFSSYK
jgi:hypothetical protein